MSVPLFLFMLLPRCRAGLINVTIDDTTSGIPLKYAPDGGWNPIPQGDTSTYKIDYAQVHNRTLHSGPWPEGNLTINFIGTTIYAFFILDAGWNTDLLFYLDGAAQPSGSFHRPADRSSDVYLYNQLVFKSGTLDSGGHRLRIDVSRVPRIFFDYAIFTFDDGNIFDGLPRTSAPASSSSTHAPDATSASAQHTMEGSSGTAMAPASAVRPQSGAPPLASSAESTRPTHSSSATPSQTATAARHTRSEPNLGLIIGAAVVGAVVVAAFCASLYMLWRRRRPRLVPWASAGGSGSAKGSESPADAQIVSAQLQDASLAQRHMEDSRAERKGELEEDSGASNGRESAGHAEPPPPYSDRGQREQEMQTL